MQFKIILQKKSHLGENGIFLILTVLKLNCNFSNGAARL